MLTPGANSRNAQTEVSANVLKRTQDVSHVERHYKTIGIGAITSALSVLNRKTISVSAPRDLPAFLRKENLAA
jgi:hypothetical protein